MKRLCLLTLACTFFVRLSVLCKCNFSTLFSHWHAWLLWHLVQANWLFPASLLRTLYYFVLSKKKKKKNRVIRKGDVRVFVVYWIYGAHYFCTQCNYIRITCCLSRLTVKKFSTALQMSDLAIALQYSVVDERWRACCKTHM